MPRPVALERDKWIYVSLMLTISALGFSLIYFGPLVFPTPKLVLPGSTFVISGVAVILISLVVFYPKISSLDKAIKYWKIAESLGFEVLQLDESRMIAKKDSIWAIAHEEIDGVYFFEIKKKDTCFNDFFIPKISKNRLTEIEEGLSGALIDGHVSLTVENKKICGKARILFLTLDGIENVLNSEGESKLIEIISTKLKA